MSQISPSMNYAARTTSTKHKRCSAHFYPGCLEHSFIFLWCECARGKANESLKASLHHKHTIFLCDSQSVQLGCLKAAIPIESKDFACLLRGQCTSVMAVKHLETLGTGTSGDANEDREVPLTMHAHTHIKQHLSVNKREGRVIDHEEERAGEQARL